MLAQCDVCFLCRFPTVAGIYELAIAVGNNTGYVPLTQKLLAGIMGGAAYTHVVAEGKPEGSVGAVVFWGLSVAVMVKGEGADLATTLGLHAGLAAIGWGVGIFVSSLGEGKADPGVMETSKTKKG